ncbi:MAG: XTP/dITP diphosphohydrolase [Flavobacteriales bacterium]|jgi:XTP/dITP diphosphohydrolase
MKKLVFATNNKNKRDEVARMLEGKYEVLTLEDIGCHVDIVEDANTLEGNALIKAKYVLDHYNLDCFADDTGLEVEALNGDPGVITARYAGPERDNMANMQKVLSNLEAHSNRRAQFRTAVCLIQNGITHQFEGIATGTIAAQKSGTEGFGYDPIFKPTGEKRTFAEMTQDEKNAISHRGQAIEKLIDFLRSNEATPK